MFPLTEIYLHTRQDFPQIHIDKLAHRYIIIGSTNFAGQLNPQKNGCESFAERRAVGYYRNQEVTI